MVKLFTDEEMDEKCKDYDPIPMKFAQEILHREQREDRVNILNGMLKSPYKTGQHPANVNMYANAISKLAPISADAFLKSYNDKVDGLMIAEERELAQQMVELEEMGNEDVDINEELFEAEEAMRRQRDREVPEEARAAEEPVDNSRAVAVIPEDVLLVRKRIRGRPKAERKEMRKEDKPIVDRITFDSIEQVGTPEVETKGE